LRERVEVVSRSGGAVGWCAIALLLLLRVCSAEHFTLPY
jgi:hypothetical protein